MEGSAFCGGGQRLPAALRFLHLPPLRRGRRTHHDRLVLAASNYSTRPLPVQVVVTRCAAWFGMTERSVKGSLCRLQEDGAVAVRDHCVHLLEAYRTKAKPLHQRFTITRAQVARFRSHELTALQLGLHSVYCPTAATTGPTPTDVLRRCLEWTALILLELTGSRGTRVVASCRTAPQSAVFPEMATRAVQGNSLGLRWARAVSFAITESLLGIDEDCWLTHATFSIHRGWWPRSWTRGIWVRNRRVRRAGALGEENARGESAALEPT